MSDDRAVASTVATFDADGSAATSTTSVPVSSVAASMIAVAEAAAPVADDTPSHHRLSPETFDFSRHYQQLFWALCRSRKNADRLVTCMFCSDGKQIPVNSFLKHYREHRENRGSCLVCGVSFFGRCLGYVYTHFSLCLLTDRVPLDRRQLSVDRTYLLERLTAMVKNYTASEEQLYFYRALRDDLNCDLVKLARRFTPSSANDDSCVPLATTSSLSRKRPYSSCTGGSAALHPDDTTQESLISNSSGCSSQFTDHSRVSSSSSPSAAASSQNNFNLSLFEDLTSTALTDAAAESDHRIVVNWQPLDELEVGVQPATVPGAPAAAAVVTSNDAELQRLVDDTNSGLARTIGHSIVQLKHSLSQQPQRSSSSEEENENSNNSQSFHAFSTASFDRLTEQFDRATYMDMVQRRHSKPSTAAVAVDGDDCVDRWGGGDVCNDSVGSSSFSSSISGGIRVEQRGQATISGSGGGSGDCSGGGSSDPRKSSAGPRILYSSVRDASNSRRFFVTPFAVRHDQEKRVMIAAAAAATAPSTMALTGSSDSANYFRDNETLVVTAFRRPRRTDQHNGAEFAESAVDYDGNRHYDDDDDEYDGYDDDDDDDDDEGFEENSGSKLTIGGSSTTKASSVRMLCTSCDFQRDNQQSLFVDRWPENKLRDETDVLRGYTFDRQQLLNSFFSNNMFRMCYDSVPDWLTAEAISQSLPLDECIDFKSTGISQRMASLLAASFRSNCFALRHVYLYEFGAHDALNYLFNNPGEFYVFPFTCLCSGNCFGGVDRPRMLDAMLADVTEPCVDDADSAPVPYRLFREVVTELKRHAVKMERRHASKQQKQQQKQPTATADSVPDPATVVAAAAAAAAQPTGFPTTPLSSQQQQQQPDIAIKKKRAHRSTQANQERTVLFQRVLVYLQEKFDRQQRTGQAITVINCHRHFLVCARDNDSWRRFTNRFCHRFIHTGKTIQLGSDQHSMRYRQAYEYLRNNTFSTMYSNRLLNLPHVLNTVAYICHPSQPFQGVNVYRLMREIDQLVNAWKAADRDERYTDDEAVAHAMRVKKAKLVCYIANKCVGTPRSTMNRGTKCGAERSLQLLNRVGRLFLYDPSAFDASLNIRERFRRYVRNSWAVKSWEDDHFYISTPLIEHGLLFYWLLVDGCFVEQINLMFSHWNFKSKFDVFSQLVFREASNSFYTRLGYIYPYFFHHYPLNHRVPMLPSSDCAVSIVRLPNTSVQLMFTRRGVRHSAAITTPFSPDERVLGNLFDMIVPLSPSTVNLLTKNVLLNGSGPFAATAASMRTREPSSSSTAAAPAASNATVTAETVAAVPMTKKARILQGV